MKKISIIIPCYNEEKGIGKVISGIPKDRLYKLGYEFEIIVIDNNSKDRTSKVANSHEVKVIFEKKQGKGHALITGFRNVSIDTDYIVMLDGDNTYRSNEIPRLIEPLESDFCDVIIGSRLEGKLNGFSLSLSHRLANWFFTFFVRRFYLVNTTDTCTGYFAWKKKVIDELIPHIKSSGFAIEAEMITKMARLGYKIYSVPITYDAREGDSKLSPILDGIKITWMLFKNLTWKPSIFDNVTKNNNYKKMKVAFVSDAIYPYNKGGKEKRIYEISTRLAKRGHNVHVYCMKWWKGKDNNRIENGVHLHAISKYYPLYSGKRRSIKEAVMFALACFKLIKEDFDVIDADHMPHLVLFPLKIVCVLKRKKMIVTWNEVWGRKYWIEYMGILGNVAYIIEKLSVLVPNKIIAVSEHTKNKLIKELSFHKRIITVPNGIDFNSIQKVKSSKNKSDIIFAGRLLAHKNVDILVRSVSILKKEVPNIVCYIIGEGPEKNKLIKLVKELNLEKNIKFFDFFNNHNSLYSLIKSSKVFVLPSTREGFGIVALEANACGIPVVTTNHKDNAAKDLIEEGKNGFICQLNEKEIANRIIKILNKNSNKRTTQTCIDSAGKYDWDKIVQALKQTYD